MDLLMMCSVAPWHRRALMVGSHELAAHMKMPTQALLGDTSDSQSSTAQKILIDLEVSLGWKRKPVLAAADSLPLLCFLRLS